MVNSTILFIQKLHQLSDTQLDNDVSQVARLRLLDYLGVTLAGSVLINEKAAKYLHFIGSNSSTSTVIGFDLKADLHTAALLNGMSAHASELDDGERFGMVHPGAPIISALLPLVEKEKLTMSDLLKGIVVGYEAAISLAGALQPNIKDRGIHATGVCGAVGAAIGVSAALNFTKNEMQTAFAAATTSASGILKVIRGSSELKPFNAGHAALNGLVAATIARAGFVGPEDVLEGEQGFMSIMRGNQNATLFVRDLATLGINRAYVKPYAACRHCHAPIEASLCLRAKYRLRPENIEQVRVITHRWAAYLHDHRDIQGITSAKMSIPYSVAVALLTGRAGLEQFKEQQINNPDVLNLTSRITVEVDEALSALVPTIRTAIVLITTVTGEVLSERVDLPKGEPENPITQTELIEKFTSLAKFSGKTEADSNQIVNLALNANGSIDSLFSLLK